MESVSFQLQYLKQQTEESRKASQEFTRESPLHRKKREVRDQLDKKKSLHISLLVQVPLFKGLSSVALESVSYGLEEIVYNENDIVIRQGDVGDSFFILKEGMVSVDQSSEDANGEFVYRQLAKLNHGATFGEASLLTEETRSATVTVISKSAICLRMTKKIFDAIMADIKALNLRTSELICSNAIDTISVFKSFSADAKMKLIKALTQVSYVSPYRIKYKPNTDSLSANCQCPSPHIDHSITTSRPRVTWPVKGRLEIHSI